MCCSIDPNGQLRPVEGELEDTNRDSSRKRPQSKEVYEILVAENPQYRRIWGGIHKSQHYFLHKLEMGPLSYIVCPWQTIPSSSCGTLWLFEPICKIQRK
jgi:hypothetical protein